jgi:heme-degrading monooxygenase HmoA
MFSVIFEVHPKTDKYDTYLGLAKMLRPELEQVEGFVDNIRYGSLTREGWILSLSNWRDEKALVRWRTKQHHHETQERGRDEVWADYHLRVGQVTKDTNVPEGCELKEQRLDMTETGSGKFITLVNGHHSLDWVKSMDPAEVARWLGLKETASGLVEWDVFQAILTPGDVILLISWQNPEAGEAFGSEIAIKNVERLRSVRVVRDYGMFDRREAPQYYPEKHR